MSDSMMVKVLIDYGINMPWKKTSENMYEKAV